MEPGKRLRDWWFTIDLRSLGAFRISLAALLIVHWTTRWPWRWTLYASDGVLPADVLAAAASAAKSAGGAFPRQHMPYFPSLLSYLDAWPAAVNAVFLAALVAYAIFLLGYRTRLFALLSLAAFSTITHRNPYVLIGPDFVFGSLLLWALVLPLGARFSVDAVLRGMRGATPPRRDPWASEGPAVPAPRQSSFLVGALGIVLQIGLIYFCTAVWKDGPTWRQNFNAAYYMLWMDQYAYPAAEWLRQLPLGVLQWLTRGTLLLEFAVLPALLLPFFQPHLRRLTIACLCLLHLAIAISVNAGLFSYVMLASFLLLLTPRDWDGLASVLRRFSRKATVYYDDDCGVCTRCAQLLAVLDRFGHLTLVGANQSAHRRHEIPAGLTDLTIVVFDKRTGRMTTRTRGLVAAATCLPFPWQIVRLCALPPMVWLCDWAYRLFAANRSRVSNWLKLGACGVHGRECQAAPSATVLPRLSNQPFWNVLAAGLLGIVLLANYNENLAAPERRVPAVAWDWPLRFAGAYQHWNMFAPDAPKFDLWWVGAARMASGAEVDFFTGKPVSFAHPPRNERRFPQILATYMKFALSHDEFLPPAELHVLRESFCRYIAREVAVAYAGDELVSLDVYRLKRLTNLPEYPYPTEESLLLCHYNAREDRYQPGPDQGTITTWYPAEQGRPRRLRSRGPSRAKDSNATGIWTRWLPDGTVAQGLMHEGKTAGRWTFRFPNGIVEQGDFIDELQQGRWTSRWPNDSPRFVGDYQNGQRIGVWTFFAPNGRRDFQVEYVQGKRHGQALSWHPNGQVHERGQFRDDKREGPWTIYHPNGRVKEKGEFRADKQHGPWTFWHADGSKAAEGTFENGEQVGAWSRWEPGVEF